MTLSGLSAYIDSHYERSFFNEALGTGGRFMFHLHPRRVIEAMVADNMKYDLLIDAGGQEPETLPKTWVKFLYPVAHHEAVAGQMRVDNRIQKMGLRPILSPTKRNHVKNKSLYPLMAEKTVLFVTMLEGEVLRGIIGGFSRYEVLLLMRGGPEVTLLRHGIYNIRDKTGRSYLKEIQQNAREWKKSPLYSGET